MGSLESLPEGKIFEGFIVRSNLGHEVILNFKNTPDAMRQLEYKLLMLPLEQIKRNEKFISQIVKRVKGDKHFIKKEVKNSIKKLVFCVRKTTNAKKWHKMNPKRVSQWPPFYDNF